MSSPASAVTVELPVRTLADRMTSLLIVAAAAMIEAALWRQPDALAGPGVAAGIGLALLHARSRRRMPASITFASGDWRIRFRDGSVVSATPGSGTRVLGPTVVLHWDAGARSGRTWLSPFDLPRAVLRTMILRIRGAAPGCGS